MPIERIWQIRLPSYANASTHVTSDGRILYLLGKDELYCLLPNRQVAWKRRVQARSVDGLFVRGRNAYVAGPTLLRLDVDSGSVLARRDIVDELPLMRLDDEGLTLYQSITGTMAALDRDTLSSLWEVPNPEGFIAFHEGLLWRSNAEGDVELIDPLTGEERRRLTLPRAVGIPLHLHFRGLYCRFCGPERIAVTLDTGEIAWRRFEASRDDLHIVHARSGGRAYAGNSALSAFDLLTGRLVWRQAIAGITLVSMLPAGHVAVGSSDGMIHVVRSSDGALLTTHDLKRQISTIQPSGDARMVVESVSSDQNTSELYLLEFVEDPLESSSAARTAEADEQVAASLAAAWPRRASDVLDELQAAHGAGYLSVALEHADPFVRRLAARRIGETRDDRSVPALIAALPTEQDDWVRREMARALARIQSDRSITGLVGAFERAIAASNGESRSVRDYAEALAMTDDAALAPLVAALETRRFNVAEWAAAALGRLGNPAAVDALVRVLDEPRGSLLMHAREALLLIGAPAVPALISALTAAGAQARQNAALILGRMRAAEAVGPVLQATGSHDVGVKAAAAEALGRIGYRSALPSLISLLKDRNWTVRKNAAEALGTMRDLAALEALLAAAADADDDVRAAVAEALCALSDRRTIPVLAAILAGRGPHAPAAVGLAAFGQECVPRLLPLLKERRFETRFWTIAALGWIGDRRAVPALAKVPTSDEVIRGAVAAALERIG